MRDKKNRIKGIDLNDMVNKYYSLGINDFIIPDYSDDDIVIICRPPNNKYHQFLEYKYEKIDINALIRMDKLNTLGV